MGSLVNCAALDLVAAELPKDGLEGRYLTAYGNKSENGKSTKAERGMSMNEERGMRMDEERGMSMD